ncbi:MAG TPA: uracil-DNA glycosylase [Planctomycetota bacterium]|jgi:DNA polymerase
MAALEDNPPLTGSALRQALVARLRFEQAMGVESVRAVALAPRQPSASEKSADAPKPASAATQSAPAAPAETPAVLVATSVSEPLSADKEQRWNQLEAAALACTKCPLHSGRTKVVFGCGNRQAKLVFVGEGPGADEDRQGIPFVGAAGQLLNKIIAAMKLAREEVYICNVVKCRPPGNRTPLPDEAEACWTYLSQQLELISPKVIVALGAPAAQRLLQTTQGITRLRGHWYAYKGIPLMPTFHPAFLLRAYTNENRMAVWDDMKKVMEKLKV